MFVSGRKKGGGNEGWGRFPLMTLGRGEISEITNDTTLFFLLEPNLFVGVDLDIRFIMTVAVEEEGMLTLRPLYLGILLLFLN